MVLSPSFSRQMGEIETVEAETMGWIDLPRGTSYPNFPYTYTEYVIFMWNDEVLRIIKIRTYSHV